MVVRDADAVGLRERKKQRLRAQLAATALALFAERGFDRVTIEEIAGAVEVSPRTFFRHFAAKEDVLFADHDASMAELRGALAARPAGEPVLAAVRGAVLALAETYEHERDLILQRARIMADTPSLRAPALERQAAWEDALAVAVAERLATDPTHDLRPRVIAGCAVVALRAAAGVWVERGEGDLLALVDEALGLLGRGLDA